MPSQSVSGAALSKFEFFVSAALCSTRCQSRTCTDTTLPLTIRTRAVPLSSRS
jgi:hypothetical protein